MDNDAWKKKPVSPKQSEFLTSLGYTGKMPADAGAASILINKQKTIKGAEKLRDIVNYELDEDAIEAGNEVIGQYSYFLTRCVETGIVEGQVIGMLFNNFKADLRAKKTNI